MDATCGNGHDSKWLAQAVGPTGMLYAFDIQVRIPWMMTHDSAPGVACPHNHMLQRHTQICSPPQLVKLCIQFPLVVQRCLHVSCMDAQLCNTSACV